VFAVQFHRFGPPEVLGVGEFPEPHAGPGQVRIRVRASGVAPVDLALRAGTSAAGATLSLPHVPGVDAAGVVDEVGPGVTSAAIGDEVFGAVELARLGGASAEFAVLAFWAPRPATMPWAEAGAAGTSIETATRALDHLPLSPGRTVLIHGAAGGVGSVAVQLAVARGARVIGTARPENQAFLVRLGAIATTYGPGLAERVRTLSDGRVDAALDVAGSGSLPELLSITGSADTVVTLADFTGPRHNVLLSVGELGGQPHGRHGLADAAALHREGRFRIPLQQVFALDQAAQAHTLAAHGPRQGKIALSVPPE